MCGNSLTTPVATADGQDEWVIDGPVFRAFIAQVEAIRTSGLDQQAIIDAIRPHFAKLLADDSWLPAQYQEPAPGGGMGSGIGTWLLYRAGDAGLALSALVVPSGAETPVHDHLAWGLVGLYRGEQDEEVFRRTGTGEVEDNPSLELTDRHSLKPGDFYDLLPETDIHRVRTTSEETSVSIHLLGIDNGCIWRHRFYPEEQRVEPFRSGYINEPCDQDSQDA